MAEKDGARRRIAEALTPGHAEKAELYAEVGRAIIRLSDIENLLAMIFNILTPSHASEVGLELFFSQGGFEKKLALVDYLVRFQGHPDEIAQWETISAKLHTHSGLTDFLYQREGEIIAFARPDLVL